MLYIIFFAKIFMHFREVTSQKSQVIHGFNTLCIAKGLNHKMEIKIAQELLNSVTFSRLDYQPLFGKMSPHSSPRKSLSSGRIKDRTRETEIEPRHSQKNRKLMTLRDFSRGNCLISYRGSLALVISFA